MSIITDMLEKGLEGQGFLIALEHCANSVADDTDQAALRLDIAHRLGCDEERAVEVLKAIGDAAHDARL